MQYLSFLLYGVCAVFALAGSSIVATAEPHCADAPLMLAQRSVDPDFPEALEEDRIPSRPSRRLDTPATDTADKRRHANGRNSKESSPPVAREYEPEPHNSADPDWPDQLGTGADNTDRQRATPDAGATNQRSSSADSDWSEP